MLPLQQVLQHAAAAAAGGGCTAVACSAGMGMQVTDFNYLGKYMRNVRALLSRINQAVGLQAPCRSRNRRCDGLQCLG